MPPEWAEHERCWMAWPCDEEQWINGLDRARFAFSQVAHAIAEFEPVVMVCRPEHQSDARRCLSERIQIVTMPLDDSWIRDSGPTFVFDRHGRKHGVDWTFNGWGKFPHDQDRQVASTVLAHQSVPRIHSPLVNEGGAIHVDGRGTVLLTESVQLNANRNPGWTRHDVEQEMRRTLGATNVIWLPGGLVDDDTDGHIDELACFIGEGKILALTSTDTADDNYPILQENGRILKDSADCDGHSWQLTRVEQPPARYVDGVRQAMSYVNFYIANQGVVMPAYGCADYDQNALGIVKNCFPDREVVQIDCQEIVLGGGNIHCITQQEPAFIKEVCFA